MRSARIFIVGLAAAAPMALSGCAPLDPLTQPGHWTFTGANEANLRAQLADPRDLTRGRSDPYNDGNEAAMAVQRWRNDRVKPLPQSGVSDLKATGAATALSATEASTESLTATGVP